MIIKKGNSTVEIIFEDGDSGVIKYEDMFSVSTGVVLHSVAFTPDTIGNYFCIQDNTGDAPSILRINPVTTLSTVIIPLFSPINKYPFIDIGECLLSKNTSLTFDFSLRGKDN